LTSENRHPRSRGAGDDDLSVGEALLKEVGQSHDQVSFADTDGVEPQSLAPSELLKLFRFKPAKALTELGSPLSTPEQAHQQPRE
jgi:hypothetical protein